MGFDFSKLTVLVVEDTEPMMKLIKSIMDTLGVGKTYCASSAQQGFDIYCRTMPDIIISDWHMEPHSGLDLVDKIRNHPSSPKTTTPIIMITGYSALKRVAEARDRGATEFLVKPFSASALAKRIAYVINKPRDFIKTEGYFGPDRRRKQIENYKGPKRRASDIPHGSKDVFEISMV